MSNEYYVKPEKPFLLIYESREDGVSVAWLETEEDLTDVIVLWLYYYRCNRNRKLQRH